MCWEDTGSAIKGFFFYSQYNIDTILQALAEGIWYPTSVLGAIGNKESSQGRESVMRRVVYILIHPIKCLLMENKLNKKVKEIVFEGYNTRSKKFIDF